MSTDLFRMQLANLKEVLPLEERIIGALNASDQSMTCLQLFDEIPDCPDRETLSRTVHAMVKAGQIVPVAQIPSPPGYPRASVAVYGLPGRKSASAVQEASVVIPDAEPTRHPWRTLPPRTSAPKPQLEKAEAPATEASAEPVKTTQPKQRRSLTIKAQIAEMIRSIPESLAISKEDIIRRLPHIKRSCLITFIPRMVEEGSVLGAIGHTSKRRYFDIRTKGKETQAAMPLVPLSIKKPMPYVDIKADALPPPVPHVMSQPEKTADAEPVFALDTNGRLRIEQGEHIILCAAETVKKLALLLGFSKKIYQGNLNG